MPLTVPPELNQENWSRAGKDMLAKALAELSYEELLQPAEAGPGRYQVSFPSGVSYEFSATRGAFLDWRVDPDTIVRAVHGAEEPATDPLLLLLDAHKTLGMTGDTTGHLIRELTATLVADTHLLGADSSTAAELADLSYVELEGYQTGHPWLIPNKGRMGFSASDAARYAPEARKVHRLPWIAVHDSLAQYRAMPRLPMSQLIEAELDAGTRERFESALLRRGLSLDEYIWMPVHPWQWDQIVLPVFAPDVASERIVPLGDGPDSYRAQQSIRTFANIGNAQRHFVKLPLSILNTLVWRGLPTERTIAAPAVTEWMLGIAESDEFIRDETRAVLLGEVASVTVKHPVLEDVDGVPYQYRELLGVIWRESLDSKLAQGERARTLAALLHVDVKGKAFVAELVERSGLDGEEWLRQLFHALLPPLLHFLYQYGIVFSPHGENTIVVFDEEDVPTRLAVKDFVDDVNVSAAPLPELADMPPEVDAALLREEPSFLRQFIQTGLFVGHFRYLAPLISQHLSVSEDRFWTLLREEVLAYQSKFPRLADRFAMFDLFTPELERLCLNRNRMLLDTYRDRPERPHAAVHGTVPNPLYRP